MGKCCDGDGQGCHVTAVLGGNLIDKQAGADRLLVWRPISKPPSLLSRLVLSPAAACRSPTHKTFRSIVAPLSTVGLLRHLACGLGYGLDCRLSVSVVSFFTPPRAFHRSKIQASLEPSPEPKPPRRSLSVRNDPRPKVTKRPEPFPDNSPPRVLLPMSVRDGERCNSAAPYSKRLRQHPTHDLCIQHLQHMTARVKYHRFSDYRPCLAAARLSRPLPDPMLPWPWENGAEPFWFLHASMLKMQQRCFQPLVPRHRHVGRVLGAAAPRPAAPPSNIKSPTACRMHADRLRPRQ